MAEMSYDDHFVFTALNRTRGNGRSSPTHSAHSAHANLFRHSILKAAEHKRAKKVRFYRNGDRFFTGLVYAVSSERFRTFDSLKVELTASPLCNKVYLPNGVRYIYMVNGEKITGLDQIEDGGSYVCASFDIFKKLDYTKTANPHWNVNVYNKHLNGGKLASSKACLDDRKEFIRPKLITIIRNGIKPRKAVRILLNKKTAHSFDQVLDDITNSIKLDSGTVKKIFTLGGKQVSCLKDFFAEDSIFIAYGPEKYSSDDFDLDDNEAKLVNPFKLPAFPITEHVVLKSPKSPRKLLSKLYHEDPIEFPELLLEKYDVGATIGEGNFAVVKQCIEKISGEKYALKIIDKSRCKGKEEMIENEVSILRGVKHPNIIQLLGDIDSPTKFYIVMELVKGGDLFDAIATSTKYTEQDASGMIYNLASALHYLHSLNIVHRDVKPENLLVCQHTDKSKSLKLGDFGLATQLDEELFTVCGTPTYVAPEILAETGYGKKVDIWASGVILYILLSGFPPFVSANNDQEELFDLIIEGRFEFSSPFWKDVSESAMTLITCMLHVDTDQRYSAEDVIAHPWVAGGTAKDQDLHVNVSKELRSHFVRKKLPSMNSAGVRLVACTALDKASRYFQGRRGIQLTLSEQQNGQDEVF